PLGGDRRGGCVSRSVLFAGQRLHRHRQYLHYGIDRARSARRTAGSACGDLSGSVLLFLSQHAEPVSRSICAVRRRTGDAGEGDLGLCLLLGCAVPARDRRTPYRSESGFGTAATTGARGIIEPGDAGVLPPMASRTRTAQPACVVGSTEIALV